jgi:hypothetical protein
MESSWEYLLKAECVHPQEWPTMEAFAALSAIDKKMLVSHLNCYIVRHGLRRLRFLA